MSPGSVKIYYENGTNIVEKDGINLSDFQNELALHIKHLCHSHTPTYT
jgi:hypothetical protein